MYATHCPCAKYGMQISTQTEVGHEDTTKTFKFYFEFKGQSGIGIMNIRDTFFHWDTRMQEIW